MSIEILCHKLFFLCSLIGLVLANIFLSGFYIERDIFQYSNGYDHKRIFPGARPSIPIYFLAAQLPIVKLLHMSLLKEGG